LTTYRPPVVLGVSCVQQTIASRSRSTSGRFCGPADQVAARHVEVVLEAHGDAHRRNASSTGPSNVSTLAIRERSPLGRTSTSSPGRRTPPATWPA
jgi:hypothetical protein